MNKNGQTGSGKAVVNEVESISAKHSAGRIKSILVAIGGLVALAMSRAKAVLEYFDDQLTVFCVAAIIVFALSNYTFGNWISKLPSTWFGKIVERWTLPVSFVIACLFVATFYAINRQTMLDWVSVSDVVPVQELGLPFSENQYGRQDSTSGTFADANGGPRNHFKFSISKRSRITEVEVVGVAIEITRFERDSTQVGVTQVRSILIPQAYRCKIANEDVEQLETHNDGQPVVIDCEIVDLPTGSTIFLDTGRPQTISVFVESEVRGAFTYHVILKLRRHVNGQTKSKNIATHHVNYKRINDIRVQRSDQQFDAQSPSH